MTHSLRKLRLTKKKLYEIARDAFWQPQQEGQKEQVITNTLDLYQSWLGEKSWTKFRDKLWRED